MNRAVLVFSTFFIGTAFLFTPQGTKFHPFLLVDDAIWMESYFYYLWQHLVLIMLMHIVHVEAKTYLNFYRYVFWFQVFDALDFMATYNGVWLKIGIPLTSNTVGCVVGVVFLIYEHLKKQ